MQLRDDQIANYREHVRKYFAREHDQEREALQREREKRNSEHASRRAQRLQMLRSEVRRRSEGLTMASIVVAVSAALLGFAVHRGWLVFLLAAIGLFALARAILARPLPDPDVEPLSMADLVDPPTDTALETLIDAIVKHDLNALAASAQAMMAVEKASDKLKEIVTVVFPDLSEIGPAFAGARIGTDRKARYTPQGLAVLTFTGQQVVTYEGAVDLTTGHSAYSQIREFFYQDIISVSRKKNTLAVESAGAARPAVVTTRDTFLIDLADGNNVTIVLRDTYLGGELAYHEIPQTMTDQTIEMIRHLVRDKKRQALVETGPATTASAHEAAFRP